MESEQTAQSVSSLSEAIYRVVSERQALRAEGADATVLERNRQHLVGLHQELGRALIERHRAKFISREAA